MPHTPRHPTADQIEATLKVLRDEPGRRWTSRGRGGHGLVFRDEKFCSITIEEADEWIHPFADENGFRAWLAELDVAEEHFSNRYWRWILQAMGTLPKPASPRTG